MNVEAARSINPEADEKEIDLVLEMRRGVTIQGKVVGPEGNPVDQAVLLSKSFTRVQSVYWSPYRDLPIVNGRFELPGCDPDQPRTLFILDAKSQLGATIVLDPKKAMVDPPVIRLKPCGSATVQLVDKQGKPIANQQLQADKIVRTDLIGMEGVLNASFGTQSLRHIFWAMTSLDRSRHRSLSTDEHGRVTFPTLIPGAPYKLLQIAPLYNELLDFEVGPGEKKSLGTVTVE